jgi:hypothetical protein
MTTLNKDNQVFLADNLLDGVSGLSLQAKKLKYNWYKLQKLNEKSLKTYCTTLNIERVTLLLRLSTVEDYKMFIPGTCPSHSSIKNLKLPVIKEVVCSGSPNPLPYLVLPNTRIIKVSQRAYQSKAYRLYFHEYYETCSPIYSILLNTNHVYGEHWFITKNS